MSIFSGSRYEGVNLIAIQENGTTRVLFEDREPISLDDFAGDPIQVTVQVSDEIDFIAARFYGRSTLWWIIADVNDLFFPFTLTEGQVLLLPPIDFVRRF